MRFKTTKCGNHECKKVDTLTLLKTGEWFWVRCDRCGFHTSSYITRGKAIQAAKEGESYISENGNRCVSG